MSKVSIHWIKAQKRTRSTPDGWTNYYVVCSCGHERKGMFFSAPNRQGRKWADEAARIATNPIQFFKALYQRMNDADYFALAGAAAQKYYEATA